MEFRKVNYLTLIYHFFSFKYTLGLYKKFDNEIYYRKARMNVFFPLFTSLNNLEGRPLHLKKRPFALYYYSLFCRNNLRETFLPFKFKNKTGLFMILFRYSNKNNFLFKRRVKKSVSFSFYKYENNYLKKNKYLNYIFVDVSLIKNVFFYNKFLIKNISSSKENLKSYFLNKVDFNLLLRKRIKNINLYRKKMIKFKKNSMKRSSNRIKVYLFENFYNLKRLKINYVKNYTKK